MRTGGYLKAEVAVYPRRDQAAIREVDAVAMTRALRDIFRGLLRGKSQGRERTDQTDTGDPRPGKNWWIRLPSICLCTMRTSRRILEAVDLGAAL